MNFVHRCWSEIGRYDTRLKHRTYVPGQQLINLLDRCMQKGIILHEIGHAFGFYHEQARIDRDSFVKINKKNIMEGKENQFGAFKFLFFLILLYL